MKLIQKGNEPRSLTPWRLGRFTYDDLPAEVIQDLREALAREQGFLCAFCMGRIRPDAKSMKNAHWASQSLNTKRTLDYSNLLGACKGGEGSPPKRQHCDTHQGSSPITVHPADPVQGCEAHIHYNTADGTIRADDPHIERDLDVTLNLNMAQLKRNRRSAFDGLREAIERRHPGDWTPSVLEREIAELLHPGASGEYLEYCMIMVYYLRKKLSRKRRA